MRFVLAQLARLVTYFLYRRLEVEHAHRIPTGRPVLVVANHFNGLLDPVLVIAALGRTPRFLAKATLGRILGVGWLMRACGVIFVQRRQDGEGTAGNVDAFEACHRSLARGDTVAIFPEGVTHDRPQLSPVKTGAARIALGARGEGAEGLVILPIGLTFTDKVALRGEVLVTVGTPIHLDAEVAAGIDEHDTATVERLTAEVERRLREVSPDFPDTETWLALDAAAEVVSRTPDRPTPDLARQADVARRLTRATADAQAEVVRQVGRYSTILAGLQIDDRDVASPITLSGVVRRATWTGFLVVVLGSLVGATIAVNAIPVALVVLASLTVDRPFMKGTVRSLTGLVAFPATWFTAASLSVDGALPVLGLVAFFLVGALAAVLLVDRAVRFVYALLRWRLVRERRATLQDAAAVRADVVAAVQAALR